jgi:hypothetical protein
LKETEIQGNICSTTMQQLQTQIPKWRRSEGKVALEEFIVEQMKHTRPFPLYDPSLDVAPSTKASRRPQTQTPKKAKVNDNVSTATSAVKKGRTTNQGGKPTPARARPQTPKKTKVNDNVATATSAVKTGRTTNQGSKPKRQQTPRK